MPVRHFTPAELERLGVPPAHPDDVDDEVLLADEFVTTLKYTASRRCVFRAPDDGRTYAVTYEGDLDVGDFEVGGGTPDGHGWYGDRVEAVEVEERAVTVTRWVVVD
ncbi:hypothetical protein [Streptomyces sp. NPDC058266]|uniref:hypothetical protein n=1 Tax=Streptomyces sp. NPDC058266 TaxID=3346412 RepID=UPI0036ED7110